MTRTMEASALRALMVLSLCFALSGCDGSTPPADSGPPPDGAADGGNGGESSPPYVIETTPEEGSLGVPVDATVTIRFSEEMGTEGTVRVRAEGADVDVTTSLTGHDLTIDPSSGWPPGAEIEVRVGDDFRDQDGEALRAPFVLRFTVDDTGAPTVVESTPAEGASDVSSRIGAIRIRFSEPMDQAAGELALEGGPGEIAGPPSWSANEVTFGVSGLVNDTTYRIVLSGFRDRAGNPFDGAPVLGDGAIDFVTRGDDEAPQVLESTPNEGQVDVSVADLGGKVTIRFDEPMDTSTSTVPLKVGTTMHTASVSWETPELAHVTIAGLAALEAVHAVDLRALRDEAGNALAPEPVIGNGWLDFTTGADAFVPYVAASSPSEGETGVPNPLREVRIAFSEAMDESTTSVPVTDELGRTTMVDGVWSSGGTVLVLPGAPFTIGRRNSIDLTGLRDLSGTALSPVHEYLGDGVLDFTLAAPTGESCEQPLGIEQATVAMDGYYEFTLTAANRTRQNGSGSCDYDGMSTDGVIHYRKTTPALSDPSGTGRALRIRTYNVSNRANIEVFRDVCNPRDPAAAAARVRCAWEHASWDLPLDVGPGDYYIWVGNEVAYGAITDIRISIEEVTSIPEGQSCFDPYDSTSAIYTAPGGPDEPHVWTVPASTGASVDITESNSRFEALSCADSVKDDVVVRFDKAADDTVLDVRVNPGGSWRRVEVVSGACRADDPAATRAGCEVLPNAARRMTVRAPAGPTYVWLAYDHTSQPFQGARLEIREVPAPSAPGSTCANAIPLAGTGTVSITPTHGGRYDGPSCIAADSDVTWYSFETTERLTHVKTNAEGAIALVDPASGQDAYCLANASSTPLAAFAPVGTRVCLGVESGSAISELTIEPIPYTGAGATAPVVLPVPTRPSLASTPYEDNVLLNESWMRVTPTRILQGIGALVGIVDLDRAGGSPVIHLELDNRVVGRGVVAIGEQLFTLSQSHPAVPRLFRIRDASGAWDPVTWDRGTPAATYTKRTDTLTADGVHLYSAGSTSASDDAVPLVRWPLDAPGIAEPAGSITGIYDVSGITMDADYIYACGRTSSDSSSRGVFRASRAEIEATGTTAATRLATVPVRNLLCPIAIDDGTAARYLYVRDDSGHIHVIGEPGGAPRYLGVIFRGDGSAESGMDVDRPTGAVYVFSTRDDPELGAWYRLDP